MNYDFAQVVKVEGEQVMVMFTIKAEYMEGKKIKKQLAGVDEQGNEYTAIGVNGYNYKINATQVERTT
jgi:hypothetical protein